MIHHRDTENTELHREMTNHGPGAAGTMINDFFFCDSLCPLCLCGEVF